jgi:hypothetical protein
MEVVNFPPTKFKHAAEKKPATIAAGFYEKGFLQATSYQNESNLCTSC